VSIWNPAQQEHNVNGESPSNEPKPERLISERSVIRTDVRTFLTIVSGILVLASLVWTNRSHIEQMQQTARNLGTQVEKLNEQIHRLEIELAKSRAARDAREEQNDADTKQH
jgi:hypothetical protein